MDKLKEKIFKLVDEYTQKNIYDNFKIFDKGVSRINYAKKIYDENELKNLIDASLDFWLTHGKYSKLFEEKLSKFLNVKYSHIVNSGSSANLLAFMSLTSYLLKDRKITRNSEIITTACCFPTTISPIIQYGAIPVFVDVELDTLNIDILKLEKAYNHNTKAVMISHTLGNVFNIEEVSNFCKQHNLWLISDECDAIGGKYNNKDLNYYSDISTFSFFPAHHMTTGEGGAVCTNNDLLNKIISSMRDWGRSCICNTGEDNKCRKRFESQYGKLPFGYDHKYVYSHFGYNLKATEMQAAVGCAQIDKLDKFIKKRNYNFKFLYDKLKEVQEYIILPKKYKLADPSWFGFYIILKKSKKYTRNNLIQILENNNIQTRMLFAGNIIKQPCFNNLKKDIDCRIVDNLDNTNKIMNDLLWIGIHPDLTEDMLNFMADVIINYFE